MTWLCNTKADPAARLAELLALPPVNPKDPDAKEWLASRKGQESFLRWVLTKKLGPPMPAGHFTRKLLEEMGLVGVYEPDKLPESPEVTE